MRPDLHELIRVAMRELRGTPITEDERVEEAKTAEIDAMRTSLVRLLGFDVAILINYDLVWLDGSAAAEFEVEERNFPLRNAKDSYVLSLVEGDSEHELTRIDPADKQFASHLLVAIGDACQIS